ncbi:hypothetical protein [Chloroflexus sp.]|uniref:hypothetical protein n=1 Tax=Chloroflexus sp. TaxID=1904827 RepID=UPI00298EE58D|nr:hypothetical protein [Chloroflexus sp.]
MKKLLSEITPKGHTMNPLHTTTHHNGHSIREVGMNTDHTRLGMLFSRQAMISLRAHWRRNQSLMVVGTILSVGCALGVIGFARVTGVSEARLLRDIYTVANIPLYTGLVSNLGILIWCVATTIWVLSAYLIRRQPSDPRYGLSVSAAAFTAFLLIDDSMMLHEVLLPRVTNLDEQVFLIGYALVAAAFAVYALPRMLRTDCLPAFIAAGLLAASYLIDVMLPFMPRYTLYEDVAKFSGIVFWAIYAMCVFRDLAATQQERQL